MAVETQVLVERIAGSFDGMKISWGGVFGGVLAGVGTLMLLSSLGIAVGISAIDPRDPDGGALGAGTAVWAGLTLLVSLFIAGWASTRLSLLWERTTAVFEGVLVWVLSLILILYLASSGIGLVASGAASLLGTTAQTFQTAVGSMGVDTLSSGNVDDILARLRDPQTAAIVANATGTSGEEAASSLREISGRVESMRDNPAEAIAEARRGLDSLVARAKQNLAQTAAEVKPEATATAWFTFATLVFSLLAAVSGAAVGRRNVVSRVESRRVP